MWDEVVGQERAVGMLRRAAVRPSHAYLLVGPRGSGVEAAARAFAAELLGVPGDDRVARGLHPDVVELEPEGVDFRVVEVRERIIPEALAAPVEGARKVLVVHEAERLNEPAANALLKTLEEPPEWTHLVLLTDRADDLLETVRSRCQRVELGSLAQTTVARVLEEEGVAPEIADGVAAVSGGRLDRARALVGPLAGVRAAFAMVPARVDGTGARVAELTAELTAELDAAVAAVEERQAAESAELDAQLESGGYGARVTGGMRRRLAERHKRALRRARVEALLEGLTATERGYRDVLAAEPGALALRPRTATDALDRTRVARDAVLRSPNEGLLLEWLLLGLPST